MSRAPLLGERPSGSRIDDLGSTHIWACLHTGHSLWLSHPEPPPPAGLASATRASALLRTSGPMR
jgi:hypothetical protein